MFPQIPYSGPLFDGSIVSEQSLPGLVRATALTASHILRTQKNYYQALYPFFVGVSHFVLSQHLMYIVQEIYMWEENTNNSIFELILKITVIVKLKII